MTPRRLSHTLLLSFSLGLAGMAFSPVGTQAQTATEKTSTKAGRLKGRIVNADGRAASDLTISLKGTDAGSMTEEDGSFSLKAAPGHYTLVISAIGIETREQQVNISAGATTDLGDITINASAQQLDEAVVKGNKGGKYKVNEPSTSLRLQTPLLETPQNIQVITGKIIADQQIFDMLEGVTRNVSGATRLEHWDNYARINMRGSQIAAFRNGMNVQMPWGPLTEDMSMVDRIEFVKGPAGFMMANGEPSGFYNVVTKKPTGINKGEVNFTVGSYNTYRSTLDLDGKLSKDGKLLYRVNMMGQLKGSFRPYDWNNRYTIAPVLTYRFNEQTSLTAEYTYQYSKMAQIGSAYIFSPNAYGDLPYDFTTAEPNLEPTTIKDHSLFLTLNHKINEHWKLTAQGAYFNYNQIGSSMWPSSLDAAGNMVRRVSIWDAIGTNKLGQVFLNGEATTGFIKHRVLAGLDMGNKEYMADWGQSYTLKSTDGGFNVYHPVHGKVPVDSLGTFNRSRSLRERALSMGQLSSQTYTGLYAQDELGFLDNRIRLTLAVRYTTVKTDNGKGGITDDNRFTPRVGLSVSLDRQTAVYALYDQAFVPQVGADYYGKAFDPITGNNTELGIKRDWFDGRWNSTVAVYRITKNNVLTSDAAHPNFSTQLGQSQNQGVEADVKGEIIRGLSLTLNYAYTDAKITKDAKPENVDKPLPGFAKHVTNGWLSYRATQGVLKGWGISLGYQWQLERTSWTWQADRNKALPDYFRMDGGISWQNNRMHVALNVNNLLDEYLYTGSPYGNMFYWQAEAPRNFRLNIGYKF